jgi:uncharacterized membrane protein YccC
MRLSSEILSFLSRRTSWSEGHVFTIAPEQIDVGAGLRVAVSMAAALGASVYFNIHDLAFAAVAVFWTFLCDPLGSTKTRLRTLVEFALLGCMALSFGSYIAHWGPLVAGAALFVLVFLCGMTRSYNPTFGPTPAQSGLISAIAVVIGISSPRDFTGALGLAAYFFLGSGSAILLTLYVWPSRSSSPGRQMLVAIFSRLEQMLSTLESLDSLSDKDADKWKQFNTVYRRAARISIERGRSTVARMGLGGTRYGRGVDAAGRTFSAIIALGHYRHESTNPMDRATERPLIVGLRTVLSKIIDQSDRAGDETRYVLTEIASLKVQAKLNNGVVSRSVLFAAEALHSYVARLEELDAKGGQASGTVSSPQVGINSLVWRHSLRVSVAVLACYCIGLLFDVGFSYWGAITTLVVMQPIVGNTWLRVLERATGSVFGGTIAALLIWQVSGAAEMALLIALLSMAVIALRLVNYGIFVIFITPMFMLLSDYLRPSDGLILARVINECLGACLGLAASVFLWPDKETRGLPSLIASAIDANIAFACAVLRDQGVDSDAIDRLQRDAGMASSRVETFRERLLLGGRTKSARLRQLEGVTVALRSICGAAAVIEIVRPPGPNPARAARYEGIAASARRIVNGESPKADPNSDTKNTDDLEQAVQMLVSAVDIYAR